MNANDAEQEIIKQYPEQFSGAPHWLGINIDNGWLPIVAQACQEIQESLSTDDLRKFHWIQIKQKWGRLTMYWGPGHRVVISAVCPGGIVEFESETTHEPGAIDLSPEVRDRIMAIVARAQFRASRTCENCGMAGQMFHGTSILCVTCNHPHNNHT